MVRELFDLEGLIKMLGVHCFLPKIDDKGLCKINHVNMLTWAASVVSWTRVYGPIRLVTTTEGRSLVKSFGIDHLYTAGIDVGLDGLRPPVPDKFHRTFWAGCKLWALQRVKESPCCMLDLDAIVWNTLPYNGEACTFLHFDFNRWHCYRNNFKHFSKYLPKFLQHKNYWKMNACNTAIMAFYDEELKEVFTDQAIQFMLRYSEKTGLKGRDRSEMVFAEQRMLSIVSKALKKKIRPISYLNVGHLAHNPYVTHLWNSKTKIFELWQSNRRYSRWMINYLKKHEPTLNAFCERVERMMHGIEHQMADKIASQEARAKLNPEVTEIRNIKGDFRYLDPNIPVMIKTNENHLEHFSEKMFLVNGSIDCYQRGVFKKTLERKTPAIVNYGKNPHDVSAWKGTLDLIGDV